MVRQPKTVHPIPPVAVPLRGRGSSEVAPAYKGTSSTTTPFPPHIPQPPEKRKYPPAKESNSPTDSSYLKTAFSLPEKSTGPHLTISPDEEKRLIDVFSKLDVENKEELSMAVGEIIKFRLATELRLAQGQAVGLYTDAISHNDGVELNRKFKDSVAELVGLKRLIDGKKDEERPTSVTYVWSTHNTISSQDGRLGV